MECSRETSPAAVAFSTAEHFYLGEETISLKTNRAITFDLWDTIINDDSDEEIRRRRGLRSKRDERYFLVWQSVDRVSSFSLETVQSAYDAVNAEFNRVWHEEFVTWTVAQRLDRILARLKVSLPAPSFRETVVALESLEIAVPPEPIAGVREALAEISRHCPLAVVSDTINTPGTGLRLWLEMHDLKQYFKVFAFSDEVGRSKPHRDMFARALSGLGAAFEDGIHIGDREHNDIRGAHALGMRAILFTATRDADAASTTADAICRSYAELPDILNRLN